MVRFAADPRTGSGETAMTDAELRAHRAAHPVVFEDGDHGPALMAKVPSLSWGTLDGLITLPFAEFADFTTRFVGVSTTASADWRDHLFVTHQFTAAPLDRTWHILCQRLGLVGATPVASGKWSRGVLRELAQAAILGLDDAQREHIALRDDDWRVDHGRRAGWPKL